MYYMPDYRDWFPAPIQPYSEVVIGAGLGALAGHFLLKRKVALSALIGGTAGLLMSHASRGPGQFWAGGPVGSNSHQTSGDFFTGTGDHYLTSGDFFTGTGAQYTEHVGDSVSQYQTNQMGFVQPYQGMQEGAPEEGAPQQEEVIEEFMQPEQQWQPERRHHEWHHPHHFDRSRFAERGFAHRRPGNVEYRRHR